jgi:hypothetical protein
LRGLAEAMACRATEGICESTGDQVSKQLELKAEVERHLSALERLLAHESAASESSPYYTQDDSPLGRRAHCAAVKSGAIKGWKLKRKVFAKREDVHAYIEAEAHKVKPTVPGVASAPREPRVNAQQPKLSDKSAVTSFLGMVGIN